MTAPDKSSARDFVEIGDRGTKIPFFATYFNWLGCIPSRSMSLVTLVVQRVTHGGSLRAIAISTLCSVTLCGILVVGLWPFRSPKNQVHWLDYQNGIRINRYGTVVSAGDFEPGTSDRRSCSIEVWLKPQRPWDKGTFLAFYNSVSRRQLSFRQHYTRLEIYREEEDKYGQAHLYVEDAFRGEQAFISVTSDGQDTAVYLDGKLVAHSSRFGLSVDDLAGMLIVANSPMQGSSWSGEFRGLAMYETALSADQVARHYKNWMQGGNPTVAKSEPAIARYLFDEHSGERIHNEVKSGVDLYIPRRYLVVDQAFLESPAKEFRRKGIHLDDILVNIAGFVPLGFLFYAYFTSVKQVKHGGWAVIGFGAIVSLTIEMLQAYLPTRDSGFTDVITNTLGTAVGAGLYRTATSPMVRALVLTRRGSHFDVPSTVHTQ